MMDSVDFTFLPNEVSELCRLAYDAFPFTQDPELIEVLTLVYGYGQLHAQYPESNYWSALLKASGRLVDVLQRAKLSVPEAARLKIAVQMAATLGITAIPSEEATHKIAAMGAGRSC